jgi:uncharacterized phage-associated protein
MRSPIRYDKETALEAILYVAERVQDPTIHRVFKLMYFADRHHLEAYGRLIFGDHYVAMKNGPVPNNTYDMTKVARGDRRPFGPFKNVKQHCDVVDQHRIAPKRKAMLSAFSDSELESLDLVIEEYGGWSFNRLTRKRHDQSWETADANDVISLEALTLGLKDRDALLQHLADPLP